MKHDAIEQNQTGHPNLKDVRQTTSRADTTDIQLKHLIHQPIRDDAHVVQIDEISTTTHRDEITDQLAVCDAQIILRFHMSTKHVSMLVIQNGFTSILTGEEVQNTTELIVNMMSPR